MSKKSILFPRINRYIKPTSYVPTSRQNDGDMFFRGEHPENPILKAIAIAGGIDRYIIQMKAKKKI
jgi:hypothetical protein